jgi:2-polyprenyl-3-methyl-5-hydroxy-6-metoxy-1,4-benzoquinol methylase
MDQLALHQQFQTFDGADVYQKIKRLLDFETNGKFRILDVGSGNGLLGERLFKLGHQVVGLDINRQAAQKSWVKVCDISQSWPVDSSGFDVVVCTDTAEHVYDPAHILAETKRVLKPSGNLIFGVPNHFDLRQRLRMLFGKGIVHWDNIKNKQNAWQYAHIRFFSLADVRRMLIEQGWEIVKAQYNFMGAGIVPARFTPKFLRMFLLKFWPGLFSGKFIFLLRPKGNNTVGKPAQIFIPNTPEGL